MLNCTWLQVWPVTTTCIDIYFVPNSSSRLLPFLFPAAAGIKKNFLRPELFLRPPWLWGLSTTCWRHFVSQITNLKTSDHFWLITWTCAVCDTVPLNKQSFEIKVDDTGARYVTEKLTEQTKNHEGGSKQSDQLFSDVRMYETSNGLNPVTAFEFYLSKVRPECDALFQLNS